MRTTPPGAASRDDAVNVVTFLLVVSLCLAVTMFAFLRITGLDPRALSGKAGPDAVSPARANLPLPGVMPADGLRLELHPDSPLAAGTSPQVTSHGNRSRPMVALTFDTDMSPSMIQALNRGTVSRFVNDAVVAQLRDLKVPATFFLSGLWIERYPAVARDLGTDPLFELASHSYSDQAFRTGCGRLADIDLARATDDLARNQTLLGGVSPHPTRYFRFPGGCYDAASLTAVAPAGVQVVQYDVVAGDTAGTDAATIISHTVGAAQPGSIVVLNVSGGDTAPATDRALPEIVRQLRARGFQLVRVSDLLQGGGGG